jgi:hypothetical protein
VDRRAHGRPAALVEKVDPGDEQILEDREQCDLDGVPSLLALRADEAAGPKRLRSAGSAVPELVEREAERLTLRLELIPDVGI